MTNTEIETIKLELDALTVKFDKMEKQMKKILKIVKKTDPDVEDTPKRQNSLAKPIDISDPLKQLMGLPKDGQSSRNDVTRFINTYIRENGLQHNEQNKREFILDDKLAKVIVPEDGIVLSFFNYQKYMKHCFLQPADTRKKESKAGSAVAKESKAGSAVAKESKAGSAVAKESKAGSAVAKEPKAGSAVAKEPKAGSAAVAKEPKAGGAVAKEPKAGSAVAKEPKAGGAVGAEDGPKVRVVRRKL